MQLAEAEARSAVADWESLAASYPYMFWWAGLWILIDVAVRQGRTAQAIDYSKMLFGPDQAKVPDPLATPVQDEVGPGSRECGEREGASYGSAGAGQGHGLSVIVCRNGEGRQDDLTANDATGPA